MTTIFSLQNFSAGPPFELLIIAIGFMLAIHKMVAGAFSILKTFEN